MRVRLGWCAVIWAICGALGLFHTVDLPHACLIAAALTAIIMVWPSTLPTGPYLPNLPITTHVGGRSDLSELSWRAFEGRGHASIKTMMRLRALTEETPGLESVRHDIDTIASAAPADVLAWLDLIDAADGPTDLLAAAPSDFADRPAMSPPAPTPSHPPTKSGQS